MAILGFRAVVMDTFSADRSMVDIDAPRTVRADNQKTYYGRLVKTWDIFQTEHQDAHTRKSIAKIVCMT